jgi:hypothetical protein
MAPLRRRRSRSGSGAKLDESLEERLDREIAIERGTDEAANENGSESAGELVDFPAAVVCALCDDPECLGCEHEQSRSGIVAIVAWERPLVPPMTRLWATARSTTRDAESFFEALPDGPVMPALRFAALSELFAVSSFFVLLVPIAAVVAPEWLTHIVMDAPARSLALRLIVLGLPAFAGLLVVAHAAHGLSIDHGATKQGAQSRKTRALRFGLYACGWDLVIGPLGAVMLAVKEGARATLEILNLGSGLPTRATKAFLRGCYRLEGERAKSALGTSYVGAALATIIGALFIFAALATLILI